jgi:hypothetical protein
MAEEKAPEKKSEPSTEEKMDAWSKRMDAMCDRMDAFMEEHGKKKDTKKDAKADAEEESEADDRKDAEHEKAEGEDDKADDKRKDAKRGDKDFKEWAKEEGEEPEHKDDKRRDAKKDEGMDQPEEMAADDKRKDRKDAKKDDDDDDDKRSDARADNAALLRRIDVLERNARRRTPVSDEELHAIGEAQTAWDSTAQAHGQRASRPMDGETLESYERRHAKRFQQFSKRWGKVDLTELPPAVQQIAFPEIRADARKAADFLSDGATPVLREIRTADRTGRIISEFVGPVSATLAPFRMPVMRVRRINNNPGAQF